MQKKILKFLQPLRPGRGRPLGPARARQRRADGRAAASAQLEPDRPAAASCERSAACDLLALEPWRFLPWRFFVLCMAEGPSAKLLHLVGQAAGRLWVNWVMAASWPALG